MWKLLHLYSVDEKSGVQNYPNDLATFIKLKWYSPDLELQDFQGKQTVMQREC